MVAFDYSRLADLYDAYCVYDQDLPFYVGLAQKARGPILELMAGTGRISLPLLERGHWVTCLDSAPSMLAVLRRKLRERGTEPRGLAAAKIHVLCADARQIPLRRAFDLILLGFQGFSELITEEEQRQTLAAAARRLALGGRFVCTLHNPRARLQTLDGAWHEVGRFPAPASGLSCGRPDGGSLVVRVRGRFDPASRLVTGTQQVEVHDRDGSLCARRSVPLRFSLLEAGPFTELAHAAGLQLLELLGDYQGSPYDPEQSPAIVAILGRRSS